MEISGASILGIGKEMKNVLSGAAVWQKQFFLAIKLKKTKHLLIGTFSESFFSGLDNSQKF